MMQFGQGSQPHNAIQIQEAASAGLLGYHRRPCQSENGEEPGVHTG